MSLLCVTRESRSGSSLRPCEWRETASRTNTLETTRGHCILDSFLAFSGTARSDVYLLWALFGPRRSWALLEVTEDDAAAVLSPLFQSPVSVPPPVFPYV